MKGLALLAVVLAATPVAQADFHWTTNGIHAGVLILTADPAVGTALDGPDTAGGRNYIGRCTLSYVLRTLEGEPVHDFIFAWDWQPGNLVVAEVNGQTITTKDLAKYPDLRQRFFSLRPSFVTLGTRMEFLDENGVRIGLARKSVNPGLVDQAGVTETLHVPGSPRWADFFSSDERDSPSRQELDRRHQDLFLKADRIQLGAAKITGIGWPENSLRLIAEEFLRREPRPEPPPPPVPSPFEQAAKESYAGRFRGQGLELRLVAEGDKWTGSLLFKGKEYKLQAEQKAGGLEGRFAEGDQSWPFSAAAGSDSLTFSAAGFTAMLSRQPDDSSKGRAHPTREMARWTNSLGMVLVPVPGTEVSFCIWETRVQDYAAFSQAKTRIDSSWRKVKYEGARVSNGPDHPVTMVSWEDARRFCRWLTATEKKADLISPQQYYRLPTDAEWSRAVGLDQEREDLRAARGRKIKAGYPWGPSWPPIPGAANLADLSTKSRFNWMRAIPGYADGYATTSPVGAFEANRYGLYDMGGNVRQWCEDWFDPEQQLHLLRGGSWRSYRPKLLLSSHRTTAPDSRENDFGFRCVLVTGPKAP
jgi:hypothetical protein